MMALLPTQKLTVLQSQAFVGDPHVCSDDKNRLSILAALYESLIRRDHQGNYSPALATGWRVEDDARTWTFTLRPGVSFHNGDRLAARDVIATIERARDPALGGELGTQGVYQSYLEGVVLTALDQYTIRVVTAEPMADLLDLLVDIPIVPRRALDHLPEEPVGSGPYRFVEAGDGVVIMEVFPAYRGGESDIKQVSWQAELDTQQRVTALLAGKADIIAAVPPESRKTLEATPQISMVTGASHVCVIFLCNLWSGVCTDRRVRQALNYALDRSQIIGRAMGGAAQPLNGPLTSLHFGYDPATPIYPYDPDKARALLTEAGYVDRLHLILDVPTSIPHEAPYLAQGMAEQYTKVGITTDIRQFTDRPAYANRVRAKQMADACCFDSSPLSTYRVLREKFHSGVQGPWWQGYINPEVDTLIQQAQRTVDNIQRQALYRRAYRLIRDDAPWIFLYSPLLCWGVGPRAQGWIPGNDGLIRLR
jgi:peptide/nickel transport system substrate-binding protein